MKRSFRCRVRHLSHRTIAISGVDDWTQAQAERTEQNGKRMSKQSTFLKSMRWTTVERRSDPKSTAYENGSLLVPGRCKCTSDAKVCGLECGAIKWLL
ncbi:topoisomerase II medium subunit [Salmonella phage 39]|nr:topoisomerase II medium subunit [Salmonella phage 39]